MNGGERRRLVGGRAWGPEVTSGPPSYPGHHRLSSPPPTAGPGSEGKEIAVLTSAQLPGYSVPLTETSGRPRGTWRLEVPWRGSRTLLGWSPTRRGLRLRLQGSFCLSMNHLEVGHLGIQPPFPYFFYFPSFPSSVSPHLRPPSLSHTLVSRLYPVTPRAP